MQWEKKETGLVSNPYRYICEYGNMAMILVSPGEDGTWRIRLSIDGRLVLKKDFRLQDGAGREFSDDDLDAAKETAFWFAGRYLEEQARLAGELQEGLKVMQRYPGKGRIDMEKQGMGYYLEGYDKDADVYEVICASPSYNWALYMAHCVMEHHMHMGELRRTDTGEPFDWFVVMDAGGKLLKVFSTDDPEGAGPGSMS